MRGSFDSFRGRSVMVTGHTGFKGSWLALWLHRLGARVTGYALAPPTQPNNFASAGVADVLARGYHADTRDAATFRKALEETGPEVVFHLAAQALVRRSYAEAAQTYETNVMGAVNLLEGVRSLRRPCVVVVVTSDHCYENMGKPEGCRETDPLGGHDPYSASKAAVELLTASYRRSFFPPEDLQRHGVKIATARAGNVIGGGDWAADRIVPDTMKALASHQAALIRNPKSIRPWQHVLEPLSGYLTLASRMLSSDDSEWCSAWNFGPHTGNEPTVATLVEALCRSWGGGEWRVVGNAEQPREEQVMRLCIKKATTRLEWEPRWSFAQTAERTCCWYRAYYENPERSTDHLCERDISEYEAVPVSAAREAAAV